MNRSKLAKLEIVLSLDVLSDVQALAVLLGIMQRLGIAGQFMFRDSLVNSEDVLRKVVNEGGWKNPVENEKLSLRFGSVGTYQHCFVVIAEKSLNAIQNWDEWVAPFAQNPGFVQAWAADIEYDFWQNARDPLQYRAVERDYSNLPMKSNGLPAPLQRMEIDISNNPGRWLLQNGYVEAIGAIIWLGGDFWRRVGWWRREQVKQADFLFVEEMENDVIRVEASQQLFDDTTPAELQNKLRALLFA